MKEHKCKNAKDIVIRGLWREFKRYVNAKLFEQYNIKFYYRAYKILFNREFILDEIADFENEVYEEFKSINQISLFVENTIRNNNNLAYKDSRDKSVYKAIESARKNPKGNNDIRLKDEFKGTQLTLNDMYIKLKEKDILE